MNQSFGDRLKSLRSKHNLTVHEVAEFVGVASSTYREWELGRAIRGEPYAKLKLIFNVTWEELMTGNRPEGVLLIQEINSIENHVKKLRELLNSKA